jgi:hypothetical protein
MKLLTTLTLILLAATAAFAQKEHPTKDTTFKDEKNRFSITYPPDWQAVPPDKGFQLKLEKGFGLHGHHTSNIVVGVIYMELDKDTPREELIEKYLAKNLDKIEASYKQIHPPSKIVASGRTRLAGRDAFFIQVDDAAPKIDAADAKTISRTIFTWESGYYYTVSFLATEQTFKQAFAEFERIISTFTID